MCKICYAQKFQHIQKHNSLFQFIMYNVALDLTQGIQGSPDWCLVVGWHARYYMCMSCVRNQGCSEVPQCIKGEHRQ